MRILTIRLKNLNSLQGEWEIDFTHPAYADGGIFAITGPTGAGKSTILDAICLALYGHTPRLGRISKGGNDIMSRHTGECHAEVTFETDSGRYCCVWRQHRAHKKPNGDLQSPRHEVFDPDSGKIHQARIRDVAQAIERTTGMDFDRFTRSMLLAQGGFAAFLQAGPDDRSPILEQITGTGIYSDISMQVHQRRAEEQRLLEQSMSGLRGVQPLGDEEELQLCTDLTRLTGEGEEYERRIAGHNRELAWLDEGQRIACEIAQVERMQEEWQVRRDAFAPHQQLLDGANRAMQIAGRYGELQSLREEHDGNRRRREQRLAQVPLSREAVARAAEAVQQAAVRLEEVRGQHREGLKVIREVRELDVQIREKEDPLAAVQRTVEEHAAALAELRTQQDRGHGDRQEVERRCRDTVDYERTHRADADLVADLSAIEAELDRLEEGFREKRAGEARFEAAGIDLRQAEEAFEDRVETLKGGKKALRETQDRFDRQRSARERLLDGQRLSDLQNRITLAAEIIERFTGLWRQQQALESHRTGLDDLDTQRRERQQAEARQAGQLGEYAAESKSLAERIDSHESELQAARKIRDYAQDRQALRKGQPCPLCGATDHPYATEPVHNHGLEREAALEDLKARHEEVRMRIGEIQVTRAAIVKEIEFIDSRKQEIQRHVGDIEQAIKRHCQQFLVDYEDSSWRQQLERIEARKKRDLEGYRRRFEEVSALQEELDTLHSRLEETGEDLRKAEREVDEARRSKEAAAHRVQAVRRDAERIDGELVRSLHGVAGKLSGYGITDIRPGTIAEIHRTLVGRRDRWLENRKLGEDLEKRLASLQQRHESIEDRILATQAERDRASGRLRELAQEHAHKQSRRQDLLAGLDPDQEERILDRKLEEATGDVDGKREQLRHHQQDLDSLHAQLAELGDTMEEAGQRIRCMEQAFLVSLGKYGFEDEAGYVRARIPEDERHALGVRARELHDEQAGLQARATACAREQAAHRERQLTACSREEVLASLAELTDRQQELQREIGGLRQKQEDNERLKQQRRTQLQAIKQQKREVLRWENLHDLIGSADGKKYRNFAQGLNFDVMIRLANRQLQKMTDRYLLLRDTQHPLELNVIDDYQAGEIRSTRNLSGGESFIVSLSLAVGLSDMASRNVRVDSLFLDEGFGTLDEEALDTALQTLVGLQRENKLIGIISHVQSIQERVGTQIRVLPRTGGKSEIIGPGCCRIGSP